MHCAKKVGNHRASVLTAIKRTFSVDDTDVVDCRPDTVTRQLEHQSTEYQTAET